MSGKYKILHLVKESEDVRIIRTILESADLKFEQITVETKEDFLTALEKNILAVILVHDHVPGISLGTALQLYKETGRQAPFIAISDNTSVEYAVDLLREGADDYILKDKINQVFSVITKALEKIRRKGEKDVIQNSAAGERKFKRLVEYGADPVLVFTPEGKTSYVSPAAEKVLGYSIEDLGQINLRTIIHPEDMPVASNNFALCLEHPGVYFGNITGRVKHKDGTWRWMEASFINLLYDEDVCGIINNFKEITAQKEAEIALRTSEEKYRSFFENSMDAILLTNPEGKIFRANPAACEIFGRTEDELCSLGRKAIVDENESDLVEFLKERSLKASFMGEISMKRKDGSKFPAEVASAVFLDEKDKSISSTIIRDISERKQIEEELRSSKENYEHLFDYNPLPNWIYDLKTLQIIAVNRAAIEHYGYSREEFLKLRLQDLRPKEEIPGLINNLKKLGDGRQIVDHGKYIHQKKDGSKITVEIHGYGINFKDRQCRLVTCIDVTEKENVFKKLKEKSEKLLSAERMAKFGYWEVGLQDHYFYWSDEVYRIWGRKREDFQVEPEIFLQTIHPDDRKGFKEGQEETIAGIKDLDYQHRIILPDGSIKWVHEKGKLVKDSNGQPFKFEGSVQDITDYKNAMLKLEQSETRQRGILKSQTNYLIRIDLEGNYSYVNDKFVSDFKWIFDDEKIVGNCATLSVKEYHYSKVTDIFEKCLANPNTVFQVEMDKLQENGEERPTLWDFICLTDANGNPVEVQGVGIDITDRVAAERSLKESNARYELVSKATSDAIYDWDISSGYLYWGESFYTLFGYSYNTLVPRVGFWKENLHPEEKDKITKSLDDVIEGTENRWEAEYRFKKADGKYSFVVEKGFILRDQNGKALRMVGALQDITEKKKLEELLDEASRFARIGSFEFDFEQDYLYWSPVTKEIHEVDQDYEPNFAKGILFYKEGESRDVMSREFARAVEEGIPYDLELQIITANGNERWVRKIGRPTFVDGKCVRINGSFQDITNIKNSELQALKASEEKQVILESIGDGFWAVDQDWTVNYFNKHAEKLLNCTKEEVLGKKLWKVFPDAVDTDFHRYYLKAIAENKIQHFEEYFERVEKWLDVTAYPSKSGLSVYFRDVTERKKSELKILELNKNLKAHTTELVEANKGLEQFSFIVSHNLRAPVANILGLADLIKSADYPEEVKENLLDELLNNVTRLDNVIADLNDILQVKVHMDAKKEPVNLLNLVNSIKSSVGNIIETEKVQITTNFEVLYLNTVQSYLHSIFYNLITNSIKYRRPGISPEIAIKSELSEDGINIIFLDNGLGIDLDKKGEQVFGLYKRFHDHVEGKGMGLFLVKTQVQLLGGKISIESEVNRGTKFVITFKKEVTHQIIADEKDTSLYGG